MPFAATQQDLGTVILSKVSERQTPYIIYTWNLNYDTEELTYETETDAQTWKQTYSYQRGMVGTEGGINQESWDSRYRKPNKKQINNKVLL